LNRLKKTKKVKQIFYKQFTNMKKKILGGIFILSIVALAAINVNFGLQKSNLSGVSLSNVEALADEISASGTQNCWRNGEGGFCPTRLCSGCSLIWFTTGLNLSTCSK
jgi:hypothetical protein